MRQIYASALFLVSLCVVFLHSCTSSTDFNTPRSAISPQQFLTTPISSTNGSVSQNPTAPPVINVVFWSIAGAVQGSSVYSAQLTIGGQNLLSASEVQWNNTPVNFRVVSDNQITATLQTIITTGTVTVINARGSSNATVVLPPTIGGITVGTPPPISQVLLRQQQPSALPSLSTALVSGRRWQYELAAFLQHRLPL
ncbi:MAG: hypothetical protein MUF71_20080 [Candidatus Kapabacteria bacterium]|jgi:hypothetical protein|nr:hypothetical protein [Candidatus Kapabacteria bacterium]